MIYGYIRVSTSQQDSESQRFTILNYSNNKRLGNIEIVSESISGKTPWRKRQLAGLIDRLQPGDMLIVSELSRLGRSMLEIFELLAILLGKAVNIHVIKGDMVLKDDIQSKVFTFAFSLGAEIERDLISQRTKEALAAKRSEGVKLGRPFGSKSNKLDQHYSKINELRHKGMSEASLAILYDVPTSTMNYFCRTRRIKKGR